MTQIVRDGDARITETLAINLGEVLISFTFENPVRVVKSHLENVHSCLFLFCSDT